MRPGKLPEPPLKRAVLGQLKDGTNYKEKNIGVGSDAGFGIYRDAKKGETCRILAADAVVAGVSDVDVCFGFHRGANAVLAAGGVPRWVTVTLLLPEDRREPELHDLMGRLDALCASRKIDLIGGQTETLPGFPDWIVNFHFTGTKYRDDFPLQTAPGKVRPGDAIVMSGYPAADLAGKWLAEEKTTLEKRFCPAFLAQAEEKILGRTEFHGGIEFHGENRDGGYPSIEKAACLAMDFGVKCMHDIGEGGVFGALRELGERERCGLTVDLKKIPVQQEVIELCELFDRNPYLTKSCGALLMVTPDPEGLVRALSEADIPAAAIGRMTEDRKMTIYNREEIRYLDHPQMDECWR